MALNGNDVGACLREARERSGISLQQIAAATRISVRQLVAIERNDIGRLPGGIFSRAFVRAYAHEVGLDPEDVVRDFVEQFPVESVTIGSPLVETPEQGVEGTLEPDLKPWPKLVAIGAVVVVGVVGLTLAFLWARGALTASAAYEPAAPMNMPPATPSVAALPVASPGPVAFYEAEVESAAASASAPVDGLRLSVESDAPCWVRIVADGVVQYEGLLENGRAETSESRRSLVLTVGDAAACRVTVNGHPIGPLGKSGQVVTLRMTPDTLANVLARQS